MALSNWDTIAWNELGTPVVGRLTSGDVTFEIYKNWVHILKGQEKSGNARIVSIIQTGELSWHDGNDGHSVDVVVGRGKYQGAVYAYAEVSTYDTKTKSYKKQKLYGIGVYGYKRHKFVGVEPKTIEDFKLWIVRKKIQSPKFKKGLRYNQGDAFFANACGKSIPGTAAGKSTKPIFACLLDAEPKSGDKN